MTPDRSTYFWRAWCPGLRKWVYLTHKPHKSFRIQLCAAQQPGHIFPKFNSEGDGYTLSRVVRNPWYVAGSA